MAEIKSALREQSLLLRIDEERAVAAIPKLLPRDPEDRVRTLRVVNRVVLAQGELSPEGKRRLSRLEKMFAVKAAPVTSKEQSDASA
jgi:hypothetical protein